MLYNLITDTRGKFNKVFLEILNKYPPLKSELLHANHASHVSKAMRKAMIKRSSFEETYLKKEPKNLLELEKKKKASVVGFIKRKERNLLTT